MLSIFYLLLLPQWAGTPVQSVTSLPATTASADVPSSTSAAPAVPVECAWTEHLSPDGYKYYYNNGTGESRVRKSLISSDCWLYSWFTVFLRLTEFCLNKPVVGET